MVEVDNNPEFNRQDTLQIPNFGRVTVISAGEGEGCVDPRDSGQFIQIKPDQASPYATEKKITWTLQAWEESVRENSAIEFFFRLMYYSERQKTYGRPNGNNFSAIRVSRKRTDAVYQRT